MVELLTYKLLWINFSTHTAKIAGCVHGVNADLRLPKTVTRQFRRDETLLLNKIWVIVLKKWLEFKTTNNKFYVGNGDCVGPIPDG